ncbi:MAG: hypothetical protein ACOYM5_05735 [Caulobacter sp.]
MAEAKTFIADTKSPLLIAPAQANQDLFVEWYEGVAHLHLGKPQYETPPAPLWIDHLRSRGYKLDTAAEIEAVSQGSEFGGMTDLFQPLDDFGWEDLWEYRESPQAKAYHFLQDPKILPTLKGFERAGNISFESRPNPMSSAHWVEVHDHLSLSLLQARLNELDLGVAVRCLE